MREASARFGSAKQDWEQHGQPYADQLETVRGQLIGQAAEFRQAQQAREAFLAKHPDVPHRLAEFSRAIEREQGGSTRAELQTHHATRAGSPRPPLARAGRRARDRHVVLNPQRCAIGPMPAALAGPQRPAATPPS